MFYYLNHYNTQDPDVVTVKWVTSSSEKLQITQLNLFIPKSYVLSGQNDIGCIEIDQPSLQKTIWVIDEKPMIPISNYDNVIGKVTVGHGLFYIRGPILSVDKQAKRMLIQASSTNGCSGTPLFDNSISYLALVHGCSKHHGNKVHMNGIGTESTNISNILYADFVHSDITFMFVPTNFYQSLYDAEKILSHIAHNPDEIIQYDNSTITNNLLTTSIGQRHNINQTLNSIMNHLTQQIWPDDEILTTKTTIEVVTPDRWNIVHPSK